jgi:hypothetical protein
MDTSFDNTYAGFVEAFVVMLSNAGDNLLLSTYLGGDGYDYGHSIYAVRTGYNPTTHNNYYDIYVTGHTNSTDFPLLNAYDSSYRGLDDAFVTKITYSILLSIYEIDSASLTYSTYLGGSANDRGLGIDVDANGYAYVTGYSNSTDFPVQYGLSNAGGYEAFVTEFSQDGTSLVWSTPLGGSNTDVGYNIAIDSDGGAIISGYTFSSDFPTVNAYDSTKGGLFDIFLAKVRHRIVFVSFPTPHFVHSTAIDFSTYLGGSGDDAMLESSMALDKAGDIYLTGNTASADFPLVKAFDSSISGLEAFVTKFHKGTSLELRFSSFLGGSGTDRGYGIAVDDNKDVYVVGHTSSSDFPVLNAYQGTYGGGTDDAFVTKLLMPIPKIDFNDDGNEDILWRYYGAGGYNYVWYMGSSGGAGAGLQTADSKVTSMLQKSVPAKVYGDAREAGDGLSKTVDKVYWDAREAGGFHSQKGASPIRGNRLGNMEKRMGIQTLTTPLGNLINAPGVTYIGEAALTPVIDLNWQIAGTGDFNGDGKTDILWRYYGLGGYNYVWYMDGVTSIGGASLTPVADLNWAIAGTGDFNRDGKVDILWRYYGAGGYNYVWYMDGVTDIGGASLPPVIDLNWQIAGTGDFNTDGKVDILWRYYGPGGINYVWSVPSS